MDRAAPDEAECEPGGSSGRDRLGTGRTVTDPPLD